MNLMIESIVAGINSLRISVLSTTIQYPLNDAKSFLYSCGRVVFPFFLSPLPAIGVGDLFRSDHAFT